MDQMRRLITTWDKIHEIIDEAMEKHDRWVMCPSRFRGQ